MKNFLLFLSLCLIVIFGFCACGNTFGNFPKTAEQGNAQAQFNLGLAYYDGKGVPKDYAEAVKWYRKAVEQGNAQAQNNLGLCYQNGTGVPKDDAEAVRWFRKAAEQGLAQAQANLGVCYQNGTGVPKDDAEAIRWFRKAAEQGNATGQAGLGLAYYDGKGVPKDYDEAVKWYRKAAEQGLAVAQNNLGWAYYNGKGVPKDYDEAVKWYRKAAEQGYAQAQANLATILKETESARQTRAKAEEDSRKQLKPPDDPKGSGTGVLLTDDGLILTAAHVVHDSTKVEVNTQQGLKTARVVNLDNANDLALLKCEGSFKAAQIKSSSGIKLGQSVFTIGFPNIQFQGFSPKMTKGEISSLSGFQDDPCHWQISVPVQPGNSGGPLFDEAGNVVGVVLAKLNAMKMAKITGDLPQNVNYAVKSIYALPLLEPYRANLAPASGVSSSPKKFEDVVEKVQKSVVLILVY
jgi:uncharacterized protein